MAGTAARVELNATFFAQVHAVSGRLVYAVRNRIQVFVISVTACPMSHFIIKIIGFDMVIHPGIHQIGN